MAETKEITTSFHLQEADQKKELVITGDWTLKNASFLFEKIQQITFNPEDISAINLSKTHNLDVTGAWLITQLQKKIHAPFADAQKSHLSLIKDIKDYPPFKKEVLKKDFSYHELVEKTGLLSHKIYFSFLSFINFIGLISITLCRTLSFNGHFRFANLIYHIQRSGFSAIPIVLVASFLMGIVVAYMGSVQLERFGAQIYTLNLVSISFLREVGVLMTAILLAGRSGSAYTAQIGTMQVNQEIDAMKIMSIDPIEVLVIPRIIALMISLPLLACLANIVGLIGGGLVSFSSLGLSVTEVADRYREIISPTHFWIGMIKAPIFAFIISSVGCFQGFNVTGNAESVGKFTTKSVVTSTFLIIIFDGIYAIATANYWG